jgi:hypothetical protein
MIFNENGYLPAGFLDWSLEDVDANLAQGFTGSQTRAAIAEGYSRLIAELARVGLRVEQWLGGAFCTAEPNPVDLDLVSLVDKDALDNLAPADQAAVERLFLGPGSKTEFLCDSYLCVILPPGHRNYEHSQAAQAHWRSLFGFDRLGFAKGIVRVQAGLGALYPSRARGGE